jgi:hypothetical protein
MRTAMETGGALVLGLALGLLMGPLHAAVFILSVLAAEVLARHGWLFWARRSGRGRWT